MDDHPDDADLVNELKDLIACQIPLLEAGIHIYGQRVAPSLIPLQRHIEEKFEEMKCKVEEKYGKKVVLRTFF